MTDLSLVYREFDKFAQLAQVEHDKNVITNDDIDEFLDGFLTNQLFFRYKGQLIVTANNTDPETGKKPYDMTGKSFKEAYEELKPILEAKVRDTYGSVSQESNAYMYDPQPRSVNEYAKLFATQEGVKNWEELPFLEKQTHPVYAKAQTEVNRIKSLIKQYFEKAMPFMLRKTMHHPIKVGIYSTRGDGEAITFDKDAYGDPVTLNSEQDLQEFLRNNYYSGKFPGGRHDGLRYLFWKPSITGKDLKIAILDIDNPAGLPKKEVRQATKNIALKLEQMGHPFIIMYTGNNFQIWYGAKPGEFLGDARYSDDYIRTHFFGMASFKKDEAIAKQEILIDPRLLKPTQYTRMFFSLHYPSAYSKKQFSGLAAVPVQLVDIDKWDGPKYAHPQVVLENFDTYASVVASFFDEVQIGQDYESTGDLETHPQIERLEDKYIEYPALSHIDNTSNSIPVQLADATKVLADEESVFAYGKVRGVDAILQYNERGGFKFGKVLERPRKIEARGKSKINMEPIKSVIVTRTGLVIHSDYITRDLERYCVAGNISEITLVGQLVKTDFLGEALSADTTQNTLAAKEGISQTDSKMMHFVVNKIVSHNNDEVPIDIMDGVLSQVNTNRIFPGNRYYFDKPVGERIKKAYEDIRNSRKGSELVVIGEEKYYITSKRKISVVVLGVDKKAKGYPDAAEVGPVYVGVIKADRNKGPVYYILAKAEIALKKEDRIKLKKLVYGKDNENRVGLFEGDDEFESEIDIVEPKVVVDVIYDDVSSEMGEALPTHYLPLTRGKDYRVLPKLAYATRLLDAKIVEIREDLNASRPTDISWNQDPLIRIQGTRPKKGFSIVDTLPNLLEKVDFFSYYSARLKEEPDKAIPYKMTTDSYKKFMKLSKNEEGKIIGFVKKKQIIYDNSPDWSVFDTDPELMGASFTFKSITKPFHLRGIDIINATKMAVHFGINWHLVFRKNKFYWIYCEIENITLRNVRDRILKSGVEEKEDEETESILSDMLSTVIDIYSPKEEVEDARVPGFLLDVLPTIELVEKNPAFHGVPQKMEDSRYPIKIDTNTTEEPINVEAYGTIVPVYYYGGRRVYPHLFQDTEKTPGEFTKAFKRQKKGEPGYKVFIDEKSLRMKTPAGVTPYYNVTSLPEFMQSAIDEKNQYGMDGVNIVTSSNTLDRIKAYKDQLQSHRLVNKRQMKEDLKVIGSKLDYIPGYDKSKPVDEQVEIPPTSGPSFDQHDLQVYKEEEERLRKSLKGTSFAHLDDSAKSFLKNPPVKKESWDALVTNYITEYKNWYRLDEPKQTWEKQSLGLFPAWAVPMLEKEMVLRTVAGKYELTDEEVDIVDLNFAEPIEEGILESTLGDLYEEVEVEDDAEYDPEDYEIIEDDEEEEEIESEIET